MEEAPLEQIIRSSWDEIPFTEDTALELSDGRLLVRREFSIRHFPDVVLSESGLKPMMEERYRKLHAIAQSNYKGPTSAERLRDRTFRT